MKFIRIPVILIFTAIIISGCGRSQSPAKPEPTNINALIDHASALAKQGKNEEALIEYNKALKMDPKNFLVYQHLGTVHTRLGAYDQAMGDFIKSVELNPAHAPSYYNRGILYFHMQNSDKAIADYSKAIELDPHYVNAFLNRAAAYQSKGDVQKAMVDFDSVIQMQPTNVSAHMGRADAQVGLGNMDEALKDFSALIEFNPKEGGIYFNRGMVYAQKKEYDKALADYSKGIELTPNIGKEAYAQRSFLYDQIGDQEKAKIDLEKVKSLDPEYYKNMLLSKASYMVTNNQLDKAIEAYSTLIDMDPKAIEGYDQRGLAYLFQKKYDLALADYTAAIERKPDDAKLYSNRGSIYSEKEETDKAMADFNKAIELDPQYMNSYFNRANAYLRTGEYEKSWADIKKMRDLGAQPPAEFIKKLEDASGQKDTFVAENGPAQENSKTVSSSKEPTGILGAEGQNDTVEFDFATLTVSPPPAWHKQANIQFSPTTKTFLLYSKSPGNILPSMAVTKDPAPPGIKSAQEFTNAIKDYLRQIYPEMNFNPPREETINGRTCSYFEFTLNGLDKVKQHHAWYQFLINGTIISLQYSNTDYQFPADLPKFQAVVKSMTLDEKRER